jgi:hypothetical protein
MSGSKKDAKMTNRELTHEEEVALGFPVWSILGTLGPGRHREKKFVGRAPSPPPSRR